MEELEGRINLTSRKHYKFDRNGNFTFIKYTSVQTDLVP